MKDDKHMYKTALERFLKLYDLCLKVDHECWYCIIDRYGYTVRDSNRKSMAWIINGFIVANKIDSMQEESNYKELEKCLVKDKSYSLKECKNWNDCETFIYDKNIYYIVET